MQIEASLICDSASDYNGKLCVLGAFDTMAAPQVPVKHPHCAFALRIRFERSEEGSHNVALLLIDADGNAHGPKIEGKAQITVPPGYDSTAINLILNINDLVLPRFGTYHLDVAINGEQKASVPLHLVHLGQMRKAA